MPDTASADPFAAAGFAPTATAATPGTGAPPDPFAGAGFAPVPAAPTHQMSPLTGMDPTTGMPIYSDPRDTGQVQEGANRFSEKVLEGGTFGAAPFIEAVPGMLAGGGYADALRRARAYTADTSAMAPGVSMLAEGIGGAIPMLATGGLINPAESLIGRVGQGVLLGGAQGGADAAGHDIGSGNTSNLLSDTGKGATLGAALQGAAPLAGKVLQAPLNMAKGVYHSLESIFSGPGKDAIAGQVLREASGSPVPGAVASSPVPDLALRTPQATGNAGLASLERTIAPEGVQNGRTPGQVSALAGALVGPENAGIEPAVLTGQTSGQGVRAINQSRDVLRQAENDLWNAPELSGVKLKTEPLVGGVQSDVANMAPSFRQSLQTGPLSGLLDDVAGLPSGASIADVNTLRSRILAQGRAAGAAGDSVTASAASQLASSLLNRTEGALGGAGDAVRDAYSTARDFTRQRAQAFGYPEFDAILRPNAAGNTRADPNSAFGRFFDFTGGSDTGPQKLQTVVDLLRATGQPEAHAAADQLQGAAQDYLRAGVLRQGRAGNGLDALGQPAMNMASLASTVNRAMPAVSGTPMLAPIAGDVQAAGNAAELLNRPSTLRGDTNSTTFEKLQNNQLISSILGQSGASAVGAAGGGYMAAEHGPESIPWYLRVPGGMLAGALMGKQAGPYLGGALSHVPGASALVTGPTKDVMRRVAAGLADPDDYRRLLAQQLLPPVRIGDPGAVSQGISPLAQALTPTLLEARQ